MWSHSSSSQASPVSRPRVEGDAVIIGKSTVIARRVVRSGCWEVEKHHPVALSRLLSMAYGKRISSGSDMVKLLEKAAAALPRNLREADQIISGLPEPLAEAEDRVQAANRLLKDGVSPYQLETALRGEQLGLRPAPAWAERLTLCDKGVVLGKGTVIIGLADLPYGGTAFDMEGKEADILALLSVARRGLASAEMLAKLAAASRALTEGDVSRAAIALAQTGQPALTDEALAKSLTFAANRLKRGMRPFDLLKSARLVPLGMSHDDWLKTVGATTSPISRGSDAASNGSTPGWDEDLHPRGDDGKFVESGNAGSNAPKDVQVADNKPANTMNDASSVDGNDHRAQLQSLNDKQFPPVEMTLSDGSVVRSPYDGKPIQMPDDVSLEANVKLGEFLSTFPPNEKKEAMIALFGSAPGGILVGEMDYQRNHSISPQLIINPAYVSFGNFNYGAVAAAAGYSLEDSIRYAALANHLGNGQADTAYGGNSKNEQMIRAGWEAYHAGNILHDSQGDKGK